MTEVLHSPSHFPSSPSSSLTNDVTTTLQQIQTESQTQTQILINNPNTSSSSFSSSSSSSSSVPVDEEEDDEEDLKESDKEEEDQLSLLALLITAFRKSMVACSTDITAEKLSSSMEIGWPTNVRHVAHVTFDRFNGFLGLPVEFEPEVHRRAPSASANVFGVSTESMQCSYDCRGNSVPTILLLMQRRLYSQGGLQAEGIFRINADNSQEEYVRDQLNRGVVPDGVDVHCLAGLIKAWFRELPTGVLDPLDPEKVMQCQTEEECAQLVSLLPPTESALLDWAINLMADIVQEELHNKMNARNVAMVFAPNMTQMVDPLTALMYAVQVMNFLRTLITKTLKDREDSVIEASPASHIDPSDENGHHSPSLPCVKEGVSLDKEDTDHFFTTDEPLLESPSHLTEEDDSLVRSGAQSLHAFLEKAIREENENENKSSDYDLFSEFPNQTNVLTSGLEAGIVKKPAVQANTSLQNKTGQSSNSDLPPVPRKLSGPPELPVPGTTISIVSRINSRMERVEAWR